MENMRKGILLAGGKGSRLYPITKGISKQLLPVYDKPMIYYPLSILMQAKIQDILLISTPDDIEGYMRLLGDGSDFGINLSYCIQKEPKGIAEALLLSRDFVLNNNLALVLGDNIFYGQNFSEILIDANSKDKGATVFGSLVKNPENFGVVEFDINKKILSIEEKPKNPKSNYVLTGLYFYDNNALDYVLDISPSDRGELEITDINNIYHDKNSLYLEVLGDGFTWLDSGTHSSLLEAGQFIQAIEKRLGLKVACLEEIAYKNQWIDKEKIKDQAIKYINSNYGSYLMDIYKLQ